MTDPLTIMTAVNASIALLKVLIPEVQAMVTAGQIQAEQQQKVLDELESLRSPAKFIGPEWEQSTKP